MYGHENEILESVLDDILGLDSYEEGTVIDPEDEMSIIEAAADIDIEEACKKEATKGKGKVCEKCGKPVEKCECSK